ncbi:MAG: hypothetical protein KGY41_08410, partial [Desulfovermiculus sp.]|nr:hypothetical protein [Desulfovermiculus sp.]
TLSCENNVFNLKVEDQGRGFAEEYTNEEQSPGKGLGLFCIQERLQDLGGTIHIHSVPNTLTRVTLSTPLGVC